MSRSRRNFDAAAELADGFARHVARWATPQHGALAAHAARRLSLATSDGHVCVTLDEIATTLDPVGTADEVRRSLLASGVVGRHDAPAAMPLVLDAADRLYLHRMFDLERRLAQRVVASASMPAQEVSDAASSVLAGIFGDGGHEQPDWQRVAAALALRQRLVVISGGPGTGKTTTVVALLAGLLAREPGARIALAAPTGKAAARMGEALAARADHLPAPLRTRLPGEAFTVHRLLGASPEGFRHHAGNPLPLDALVVDEASMLDLELATRLFEAMPRQARIVLLGDKDQLAAVESGAVFAELGADPSLGNACRDAIAPAAGCRAALIAAPPAASPSPLRDVAVWFQRNYRFGADSGIGRAAVAIRDGRSDELLALLNGGATDLHWIAEAPAQLGESAFAALGSGYAPFVEALRRDPRDAAAATAAFARFRVLCAMHDGPQGVDAVNEHAVRHVRAALGQTVGERSRWFIGQPVMVLRNEPALRLFNGDVGIVLAGADGEPVAMFAAPDGGWRAIPPVRLPAHDTAFAMTVHKSQGSEFDEVLVMLPDRARRVASRELLYTAVTRARSRVVLAASAAALTAAVARPTRRGTGLLDRLRDAMATAKAVAMPAADPTG
jgi:exodeoxyribonuclease V alpha subunit